MMTLVIHLDAAAYFKDKFLDQRRRRGFKAKQSFQ